MSRIDKFLVSPLWDLI
jgi:hypothetical protein